MRYRGCVRNGVVVLESGGELQEGTVVDVEPVEAAQPPRGSAAAILRHAGIWGNDVEEVDRLLADLRAAKQAEVQSCRDAADDL